ncbi:MAG: hypothetical protein N2515_00885 [Deltaproteobacteria bacterium]|nr:hypothetical protein [Deltaproteobacteria bacterium]
MHSGEALFGLAKLYSMREDESKQALRQALEAHAEAASVLRSAEQKVEDHKETTRKRLEALFVSEGRLRPKEGALLFAWRMKQAQKEAELRQALEAARNEEKSAQALVDEAQALLVQAKAESKAIAARLERLKATIRRKEEARYEEELQEMTLSKHKNLTGASGRPKLRL